MKRVIADIEADGFWPTRIWVIVTREEGSNDTEVWLDFDAFKEYAKTVDEWVFHNGLNYDVPHINRLLGDTIDPDKVWDTFVIARLVEYSNYRTHSLDEIGTSLGKPKTEFNDFSKLSQEMIDYCIDDVDTGYAIYQKYKRFIEDSSWHKAILCEQRIARVCFDMHNNGFKFNRSLAEEVLVDVKDRMSVLEEEFQRIWPPALVKVGSVLYRIRKDGELYPNVKEAIENYPKTERRDGDLILYDYIGFNPASPKHRIDKLWEAGWNPIEKTDTHQRFSVKARPGEMWGKTKLTSESYQTKLEYFRHYGWTVNEGNLETLPEEAPDGARALAEWLTLNGRLKALEERLRECESDNRIRTKFWNIGAWTHRMSHSNPNLANISSPWNPEKKPKNPVQLVKSLYDSKMREMFCVPEGSYLLGTDAESIQLRILAHYLKNDEYVHAIVSGNKEDESDIHNVNRRALGLSLISRDHAKTFIYAWLLGAGVPKVASILGCSHSAAKQAVESFIQSTKGLGELKSGLIRSDASRGYFEGLDGRKVLCDSDYLMLAGYLQNGEAVVMKHSNWLWREWADKEKINYKQVNFVHDEWQTQVDDSLDATERLAELQCQSITEVGKRLNVYCPLSGDYSIGTTWLETH